MVEVSIFYKSEKTSGQTVRPIKINTVALFYLVIAAWSSNFFVAFTMLWTYCIRSKNEVAKFFSHLGQDRGVKNDRKATALYLIFAAQASNFYHGFYNALDIFSPKIKTLS